MKRLSTSRVFVFFGLVIGLTFYAVWPREPAYQGKDLSAWVKELAEGAPQAYFEAYDDPLWRDWEAHHGEAIAAVRNMGAKALPYFLEWLRSNPGTPSTRDKLQDLIDEHSPLKVKLPRRRGRTDHALLGFRALGPAAEPSMPELRRLLHGSGTGEEAALALCALGPGARSILTSELTHSNCPAQRMMVRSLLFLAPTIGSNIVPVLADGVTNPSCQVHEECLAGLGELGPTARAIAPWVAALAQKTDNSLAGLAMRVLVEVSDEPEQYIALFSGRLNDTNVAAHAAFALGRMGSNGVPPLLLALTNREPDIKAAALAALDPKLRRRRLNGNGRATAPAERFSFMSYDFDHAIRRWFGYLPTAPGTPVWEDFVVPHRLATVLDHPNPAVRLEIVSLLARYGRNSAIGLSRATKDPNEEVRAEAKAALVNAGIEVSEGAIIRGSTSQRQVALIFAGHRYAEGAETILSDLARHKAQASFFVSSDFLQSSEFAPLVRRMCREGHYLGPYSLRLWSAGEPKLNSPTHEQFDDDFRRYRTWGTGVYLPLAGYFLPPQERGSLEIAEWASDFFYTTVGETPGTRSAADCTGEADPDFASSKAIVDSIVAKEQQDPHGLNGVLLLLHVGSGPARVDKFHARFGELLDYLTGRGYQFVAIDELFDPQAAADRRRRVSETLAEHPPGSTSAAMEAIRKRYGLDR